MSKVYEVIAESDEWGTVCTFVRADSRNQARANCVGMDELGDPDYIDLRAVRVPWADSMEDIDVFDYPFKWQLLKHGRTVWVGPDFNDALDPEDVPMVEAYGGLKAFCDALLKHYDTVDAEANSDARESWQDLGRKIEEFSDDA